MASLVQNLLGKFPFEIDSSYFVVLGRFIDSFMQSFGLNFLSHKLVILGSSLNLRN